MKNIDIVKNLCIASMTINVAAIVLACTIGGTSITSSNTAYDRLSNVTSYSSGVGVMNVSGYASSTFTSKGNVSVSFQRLNNFLYLGISNFSVACSTQASYYLSFTYVPPQFKPPTLAAAPSYASSSESLEFVITNSAYTTGTFSLVYLLNDGYYVPAIHVVKSDGTNFAASGNCGWDNLVYSIEILAM